MYQNSLSVGFPFIYEVFTDGDVREGRSLPEWRRVWDGNNDAKERTSGCHSYDVDVLVQVDHDCWVGDDRVGKYKAYWWCIS